MLLRYLPVLGVAASVCLRDAASQELSATLGYPFPGRKPPSRHDRRRESPRSSGSCTGFKRDQQLSSCHRLSMNVHGRGGGSVVSDAEPAVARLAKPVLRQALSQACAADAAGDNAVEATDSTRAARTRASPAEVRLGPQHRPVGARSRPTPPEIWQAGLSRSPFSDLTSAARRPCFTHRWIRAAECHAKVSGSISQSSDSWLAPFDHQADT